MAQCPHRTPDPRWFSCRFFSFFLFFPKRVQIYCCLFILAIFGKILSNTCRSTTNHFEYKYTWNTIMSIIYYLKKNYWRTLPQITLPSITFSGKRSSGCDFYPLCLFRSKNSLHTVYSVNI